MKNPFRYFAYPYKYNETSMIPNFAMFLERSLSPHKNHPLRIPFYLTSTWRLRLGVKGVSMQMNPDAVTFRQEKRMTERDTQGGKVFFHWTTQAGTNDDVLRMSFSGQTGSIHLQRGTRGTGIAGVSQGALKAAGKLSEAMSAISGLPDGSDNAGNVKIAGSGVDTSGASRIANFHNLWSLTREPVVDPQIGVPVYYYVTYTSPLFGNTMVTFIGHFNRSMEIADDARDLYNKRYSFEFTAHGSIPPIHELYSMVLQNLSQTFINDISG